MPFQAKYFSNQSDHLLIQTLNRENINTVFGSIFPLPYFQSVQDIVYQQLTHEQSIIHAADGFARATGQTGTALITTDYGITNAITGIATAHIDSVPLLILIQKNNLTNDCLDIEQITKGVSKHCFQIRQQKDIPHTIQTAHRLTKSDHPGVVVVEFQCDLFCKDSIPLKMTRETKLSKINPTPLPSVQIRKVAQAIKKAHKPLILIGGGVIHSGASDMVKELIDLTHIPYTSTLMGLDALDTNDPLFLGMVGMHGTFAANRAVHRADLLICLGVRFSDRITGKTKGFSPSSKKIQIEIDPAEINKNVKVDLPIIGDISSVLAEVNAELLDYSKEHWGDEVKKWRKTSPQFSNSTSLLKPDILIKKIHANVSPDIKVVTDVGQHQMWTALHFPFSKPRQLLTSGGFGTMGYGLPAAIGAANSKENQPVLFITGDGSIQMNIQELVHVAKNNLNIKIIILRNGYLGMVRQWQQLFYQHKYSQVKISSPNFGSLAESYGITAYHAENMEQADAIIAKAFSHDKPALLDFLIEEEMNVYPIVPPGGNNTDALLGRSE